MERARERETGRGDREWGQKKARIKGQTAIAVAIWSIRSQAGRGHASALSSLLQFANHYHFVEEANNGSPNCSDPRRHSTPLQSNWTSSTKGSSGSNTKLVCQTRLACCLFRCPSVCPSVRLSLCSSAHLRQLLGNGNSVSWELRAALSFRQGRKIDQSVKAK